MKETIQESRRQLVWVNIIFFVLTTLIAIIGTPLYLIHFDLSWKDLLLFSFYIVATGMSITVGYHRLFAHRSFKASPIVEFFVLFFGAAAFEQSALKWASQHRDHHLYVDTDRDPYSIKKGFFYAHIGWLIFWRHPYRFEIAHDLQQKKMLMNQHHFYYLWSLGAGILFPVLLGALWGGALAAFIFTVCLRLTIVYHSTFCINSVCHMFGKATYDIYSSAKDHWFVAMLTFGEGYHNFHHRFPSDYRNAVRWYQWDPSKWMIFTLKKLGLARDLKRVSKFRILEAKLAAETQTARDWISEKLQQPHFSPLKLKLEDFHKSLKHQLIVWEQAAKENQENLRSRSVELRETALQRLGEARELFQETRRQWRIFHQSQLGLAL